MKQIHLEKKGLRCFSIAESFFQKSTKSFLAGTVMSTELIIDGFEISQTTLYGNDSTKQILKMYDNLNRSDINFLLIGGAIISMYNIIDLSYIFRILQIPIISITFNDSEGIPESIKHHFPNSYESKLKQYESLPTRKKITLHTNQSVFVRNLGCTLIESQILLNRLTLHGSIPEPIRISKLLSKSILTSKF